PDVPAHAHELAMTRINLGCLLFILGKYEEVRTEYAQAQELFKNLAERYPAMPQYRRDLATSHYNLGCVLGRLNQRNLENFEYEQALDLQTKLAAQFPDVRQYQVDLGGSCCNYGVVLSESGKPNESLEWFDKAIQTLRPLFESEPRDVVARDNLFNSYQSRAILYDRLERFADAVTDWVKAIELAPAIKRPKFQSYLAVSHKSLAGQLKALDRPDESKVELEKARDLWKALAEQFPDEARYRQELAGIEDDLRKLLEKPSTSDQGA
ncbi:MAG TPA: hypothetical protein VGX78_15950, partial [Pirellulales bacterium]|nr:hypothetical protein [Pirellulales bacterium]